MSQPKFSFRKSSATATWVPCIDGEPCASLVSAEMLLATEMTDASYKNHRSALSGLLNRPGMLVRTEGGWVPAIVLSVKVARRATENALALAGATKKKITARGGFAVKHPTDRTKLGRQVAAGRKVVDARMRLGLSHGQNFAELDGYHDLTEAERAVMSAKAHKGRPGTSRDFRIDTGARWCFGRTHHRLRTEYVFSRSAMLEAAKHLPPVAQLPLRLIAENALRGDREACGLTMYGIHVERGFERPMVRSFNKGDGDEPSKTCSLTSELWSELLGYIDGDRRRYDPKGRGLASFEDLSRRAAAGDVRAEKELRRTPVFLVRGGGAMTRANLMKTYLRPAFRAAGIECALHQLRHEYVYDRLREIESMVVSKAEKARLEEELARFMGWSSTKMLEVYDAFERARRALEHQLEFQKRRSQNMLVSQRMSRDPDGAHVALPFARPQGSPVGTFLSVGRA